jgi:1-deoxy-D-xylulose-5-phosphate synthase
VAIYSTFLQRSYSSSTTYCLQNLPVTICVDRAGLVGDDGKTHHRIYDVAYTRGIPNMTVAAPRDENELQHLLATAISSGRPFTVRYPRGAGIGVPLDETLTPIPIGKGEIRREGRDIFLMAYGSMVPVAEEAAATLKPLDLELLRHARESAPRILTLEEHLQMGGFGSGLRVHGIRT